MFVAFQALSVRKHQETVELTMNLEESQLEAIKQIKQTCQGMPLSCGKKDWPVSFMFSVRRCRLFRNDGCFHEGLTPWIISTNADASEASVGHAVHLVVVRVLIGSIYPSPHVLFFLAIMVFHQCDIDGSHKRAELHGHRRLLSLKAMHENKRNPGVRSLSRMIGDQHVHRRAHMPVKDFDDHRITVEADRPDVRVAQRGEMKSH